MRQIWMMVFFPCAQWRRGFRATSTRFFAGKVAKRKNSRYPEASKCLVQELLWRAHRVQARDVFVRA